MAKSPLPFQMRVVSYRIAVDGRPVMVSSRLGLEFGEGTQMGPAAVIANSATNKHSRTWENRFGKSRIVADNWREFKLALRDSKTGVRAFGLIMRAYDDGVAFRYDLPMASGQG